MEIEKLSTAELETLLASRKAKENEERNAQREAYERMKGDAVYGLTNIAKDIHQQMKDFKKDAFETMQTLYSCLQEYSERHAESKGNFRLEVGDFRVNYRRQGKATFDERADQAEKHIIDFVNSKFANDEDTKDLIMSLLERKKGDLDVNLIQKLYAMEDRFNDPNWKKGIELLKESYQYSHSKDYITFEERDANNEWKTINLQFSNI